MARNPLNWQCLEYSRNAYTMNNQSKGLPSGTRVSNEGTHRVGQGGLSLRMEPSGLGTIRYFSQMNIIAEELTVEQFICEGRREAGMNQRCFGK